MSFFVLFFKLITKVFQRKREHQLCQKVYSNCYFTLMMSFLMVYVMICYNISLNIGGMSNKVFLMAFGEMKIMWPVAFLLEFFIVDKLAHALAFRMVTPNDRPIVITLAISAMIICIMCPVMSLIATVLFKNAGSNIISTWFQTTFFQFSCCIFLADVLLRTMYPFYLWKNVFK